MKRSVCVFALVMLCMGFVFGAENDEFFFENDFYGVTWGMTRDQVRRAFSAEVVKSIDIDSEYLNYWYKDGDVISHVCFKFDESVGKLGDIVFGVDIDTSLSEQYVFHYLGLFEQKYGAGDLRHTKKTRVIDGKRVDVLGIWVRWLTPKLDIVISLELIGRGNYTSLRTLLKPVANYLK